jgi:hypothetical protein
MSYVTCAEAVLQYDLLARNSFAALRCPAATPVRLATICSAPVIRFGQAFR